MPAPSPLPAPIRVVCVDDNDMLAQAMERWVGRQADLSWAGWVRDCDNPVDQIIAARPDVVLMDVDMPGCDSLEAAARLVGLCPAVRVVMFSGHLRGEYIDRAFALGASGFVCKDDPTQEVLDAIRSAAAGGWAMSGSVARLAARGLP